MTFTPSRVELINNEPREVPVVDDKGKSTVHSPQGECEQDATVEKTLNNIREKYILNKVYYELSVVNKDMPPSCSLTKCAKELKTHKSS